MNYEVGLTTKYTKGTKEERLIEDNSPYLLRGFQAWAGECLGRWVGDPLA